MMKLFDDYTKLQPDFISEEGHMWFIMDCLTAHCTKEINPMSKTKKLKAKCFKWVSSDHSDSEFVLIGENQEVIHANKNYEAMAVYIECLRVASS